jgi:hypothetical protein
MHRSALPRHRRWLVIGLATALAALVLSGCTLTGGGWMFSAASGRATFGFNITCDGSYLTGNWVYHDKAAGVDVTGTIPSETFPCSNGGPTGGLFEIETPYRAQHCKTDCEGTAFIAAYDDGTGKPPKGDELSIELDGGPYDGYENEGDVQGGNLEVTLDGQA